MRAVCSHEPCRMTFHNSCIGLDPGYYKGVPEEFFLCVICKGFGDIDRSLKEAGTGIDLAAQPDVFLDDFDDPVSTYHTYPYRLIPLTQGCRLQSFLLPGFPRDDGATSSEESDNESDDGEDQVS